MERMSRDRVWQLVQEFRQHLAGLYGERLRGVYLYGSYARGEADKESDIDVAVVLAGPVKRSEERRRTIEMISELSLRENCLLLPFFLSEEDYRTAPEAIHRSIVREGVPV